jgi:hypothetical protein
MSMKINRKMNLVIPVETGDVTYHVHSEPLSQEMFDEYFVLIAQTFNELFSRGLAAMTGPRVAAKMLKRLSVLEESEPGKPGIGAGAVAIMNEIRRLTMVIGAQGGPVLLEDAVRAGIIDGEDKDILENALVFFIVVSAVLPPAERRQTMERAVALWSGQLTSLNSTAFADSLPKSTPAANSGVTVAGSSVPS